jgi:hypothetical protein
MQLLHHSLQDVFLPAGSNGQKSGNRYGKLMSRVNDRGLSLEDQSMANGIRTAVCSALMTLLLLSTLSICHGAQPASELEKGFVRPPESARPWVYWFWLNGNITREGITADLEAMKRVGIGGVLIMEVDQGVPLGPLDFMSPPWRELFKHVVSEARRLGLEVNMNDDAGWNGSGGPWIKPEQSMQKVVWSETSLEGSKRFEGTLPQPETVAGYYRDITVLAFPTPGDFRIDNIQGKAAYERRWIGPAAQTKLPAEMVIDRARIIDLSASMDKEGRLTWDAPAGKWTVLRIGHTSTGMTNAPSPESGRGLECDKLSKEGIEAQFAGMMGPLITDVGSAAGKTLVATHIDSWENGSQNWTARMREEFQKRRGYDLLPFLPTLSGRVVESLEVSERFLWDLRQTVSDLVVEDYAGHMAKLAQQRGLRLSIEAYGGPCDDMTYAGRADEPMCEFWIGGGAFETCKEMASAAHTYGKRILGAESFTADDRERWLQHQGPRGPGVLRGREPVRVPPLCDAAVAELQTRDDDGPLGPALRAHCDMVGAIAAMARVPLPLPVPAAAGPLCRGYLLPATGGLAPGFPRPQAKRPRLRQLYGGGCAHTNVGKGRTHRSSRRHELSAAGVAGGDHDDAASAS